MPSTPFPLRSPAPSPTPGWSSQSPVPASTPASASPSPVLAPVSSSSIPATPASSSPRLVPDNVRRPSPWHEIAHSLSTASLPRSVPDEDEYLSGSFKGSRDRRFSSHSSISGGQAQDHSPARSSFGGGVLPGQTQTQTQGQATPGGPGLGNPRGSFSSTSQALRDWDRLLSGSEATRHQLLHSSPSLTAASPVPKLSAERDKDGHIEYKLKLIEPSPERFERLVTQMMWRLKQGRNEAIYELGLADDGTVIGLTRAEMDASLRTLELMASEVGATVIVLKEIVLTGAAASNPPRDGDVYGWGLASEDEIASLSLSSSAASLSALPPPAHTPSPGARDWVIRRPDLDEQGRPRRGTKSLTASGPEQKSKRERAKLRHQQSDATDLVDTANHGVGSGNKVKPWSRGKIGAVIGIEDDESPVVPLTNGGVRERLSSMTSDEADVGDDGEGEDDPPTFHLDLDDSPSQSTSPSSGTATTTLSSRPPLSTPDPRRSAALSPSYSISHSHSPSPSPSPPQFGHAQGPSQPTSRKSEAKRQKSAARREQRRLDLLRGDGTSPFLTCPSSLSFGSLGSDVGENSTIMQHPSMPPSSSIVVESIAHAPSSLTGSQLVSSVSGGPMALPTSSPSPLSPPAFRAPHQPARPSSLRLAEPAPDPDAGTDGIFLDSLLHVPLDSLSLSFADVRMVDTDRESTDEEEGREGVYATSPSTETETEDFQFKSSSVSSSTMSSTDVGTGVNVDGAGKRAIEHIGLGPPGEEMICVEALVVRKVQHGHGLGGEDGDGERDGEEDEGEDEEEEEGWYGGEADGWGLGGDD